MANVLIPNNPLPAGGTNTFECMWRLTRAMKKAGWTTVAHSNGSVKTAAGTNNNDSWGNNVDPLLDSYPAFNAAVPWIVMRGPSTLKIPINVAPTGVPLRGEKITQTATSAEGELIGYVFDSTGSSGWMVVAPRVGTFNTSTNINCSLSGASFTPAGTIVTYVREVLFSKYTASDNVAGQIFYICADVVAENAQLYSTLAASSGATAVVCPGGGGTGNSFPALGIVIRGVGGTMATGGGSQFLGALGSQFTGSYHVACANNITGPDVSADGSFFVIASNAGSNLAFQGFMFTRMDDGDPGDCDPYAFCHNHGNIMASYNRTSSTSYGINQYPLYGQNIASNTSYPNWFGYQARGCPVVSRDIAVGYNSCGQQFGSLTVQNGNYPVSLRTVNHPATSPPLVREAVLVFAVGNSPSSLKHLKGRTRWMSLVSQGSILDTYDNKKFICVGNVSASYPGVAIGPWDGTTTPIA